MHVDPIALMRDIADYRAGNNEAGNRLCVALGGAVRLGAARMLGDADADVDDVTQDALIATLGYLRRDEAFAGDLVRLAVTIVRNRCRDLLWARRHRPMLDLEPLTVWLASPRQSPLEDLAEAEMDDLLQDALNNLSVVCRRLLKALYIDERTPEQVRVQVGLATVQGIYHRRSVCLEQLKKFVQRRLRFGSFSGSRSIDDQDRSPEGPAS